MTSHDRPGKRLTLFRPKAAIIRQSVDVHDTVEGLSSAHPGGPTVADAFKSANITTPHVMFLRDGTPLKPEDDLFGRVSNGDEVMVLPAEEVKTFQEYPKRMFGDMGRSLLVTSQFHEEQAKEAGYKESAA
jgi:hypothetical protein